MQQTLVAPERILVVGFGVSGKSVVEVLLERGKAVEVLDNRAENLFSKEEADLEALKARGVVFWLGGETPPLFSDKNTLLYNLVVVSPGVAWNHSFLNACRNAQISVLGELEWALLQLSSHVVVITGSNGKTTTALLVHHLLTAIGKSSYLVGNIGTPVSSLLLKSHPRVTSVDVLVVEASSYQLEASSKFEVDVAVILNLSENHLERHGSLDEYLRAKLKPFSRLRSKGSAIAPNTLALRIQKEVAPSRLLTFGQEKADTSVNATVKYLSAEVLTDEITVTYNKEITTFVLSGISLLGIHNRLNIAAALLVLEALGVSSKERKAWSRKVTSALLTFSAPLYRLQLLESQNGTMWLNDSKSTTPESTRTAIDTVAIHFHSKNLIILIGGAMKQASWANVWELINLKAPQISRLICFGSSFAELFKKCEKNLHPSIIREAFPSLSEALQQTASVIHDEVVVFTPGCASFDEFQNFEERGCYFQKFVESLAL
jgi:UDP-N-acetylmuramoylalanine--D-glutamate ligase